MITGAKKTHEDGQAMLELVMLLPILVLFVVWMFNSFKAMRAATVAQQSVYVDLISRLDNRPMPTIDGLGSGQGTADEKTPENTVLFAVQSRPAPNQQAQEDSYSIRIDSANAVGISTHDEGGDFGSYRIRVGICLFPGGACAN